MAITENVTMTIQGAKEIERALTSLPLKVQAKCLSGPVREAGQILLAAAKANTPTNTGTLLASVQLKAATRQPPGSKGVVVGVGKRWFVGPTYYGAFVEFGHRMGARPTRSKRGTKADRRPMIPGEHFLEYAYEEVGLQCVDVVIEGIRKRVDKAIAAAKKEGGA